MNKLIRSIRKPFPVVALIPGRKYRLLNEHKFEAVYDGLHLSGSGKIYETTFLPEKAQGSTELVKQGYDPTKYLNAHCWEML